MESGLCLFASRSGIRTQLLNMVIEIKFQMRQKISYVIVSKRSDDDASLMFLGMAEVFNT